MDKNKKTIVCQYGVNDMYRGWTTKNKWNKLVYIKWHSMICRCYSEKFHKRRHTYIDCTVCDEWLLLSNFVRDIIKIDGYDYEKFINNELSLDKDIKSNGINKEYSLKNCKFVSISDNSKQAIKEKGYFGISGENHFNAKKVAQYDKQGNLIKIWDCIAQASKEFNVTSSAIINCCKGKSKTSGGFIWKYID